MATPAAYVALSVGVLVVVALLAFLVRRGRQNRLTPLAGLAFAFVVAGIIFGDDRAVGYSLMGVGVAFAIADMVNRSRRRQPDPRDDTKADS